MANRIHLQHFCRLFLVGCTFLLFSTVLKAQLNIGISISGPGTICQYDCGTYTATVTPGSSQQSEIIWSINGTVTTTFIGNTFIFCPGQFNFPPGYSTISATYFGPNGGTASDTIGVNVIPPQTLTIKSSNVAPCNDSLSGCEKVCPGATVVYSILSNPAGGQGPANWQVTGASNWFVNPVSGNPSMGSSITVTWGPTGPGEVRVSPNDAFPCTEVGYHCVTIIEAPQAAFTTNPPPPATGNLSVCKNQTVYFQNQSSNSDVYKWSFSDDLSSSDEVNPEHVFLSPGTYTVSLIAYSNCLCSDTTQMTIEVLDAESPSLDCVGTICPGETITYTASNGCQPFSWMVSGNGTVMGGGTATSDTISILWNNGPSGTITLGAQPCSGMVCPLPATLKVPILSNNAEIEGRERVCPSSTEVYRIEPFGGTSFTWTLDNGGTITEGQGTNRVTVSWSATVNQNASHWLSVVYQNCYLGCGGQDSIEVHILSTFAINGPVEVCQNGSVPLVSKLLSGNQNINTNWTMFDPTGTSMWTATSSAAVMPDFLNGPGRYHFLAVPSDPTQTCSDQQEWAVMVAPLPNVPTGITGERNICPDSTYSYEAQGVASHENVRWTVQNGAGAPQTLFGNPVNVAWAAAGPYQLAAATISTNGLNCSSDTIRIDPVTIGIPAITGTLASCEDAVGSYSIIPQNIDVQWFTTPFGAGAVADGQGSSAVEIFWTVPGNHTVNVAVCGQTASFPVTVWANPDPMVQHPVGLCPGATAVVQTSVPFSTYKWKDEDGALFSLSATPSAPSGTYSVEVSDGNGCLGESEFTMASYDAPDVSLTTADPTGFCNNSVTVMLTALTDADANYTYQWFRDATAIAGEVNVEYATNQYGYYTVQATNMYGCTQLAGPINVFNYCGGGGGGYGPPGNGNICPAGAIDISYDPNVRCDSFQFHLIDNLGQYVPGSANWLFFISGGSVKGTGSGENPMFVFDNAGKYIAAVSVLLQDGSTCKALTPVLVETVARFDHEADCPGSITALEDVSEFLPSGGITSYAWDFGDPGSGAANTDNVANPDHTFAASGIYQVQLTVTGMSGCTSSATLPVEIPAEPDASFATPAARCAGNALLFTPANIPGDLLNVVWDFGDPASGSANDAKGVNVYHNYNTPNTYTVTATATNVYGCTASYSMPVVVSPNPLSGSISPANPGLLCEGQSMTLTAPAGAVSYLWSDSSMTTTPTLVVSKAGVYTVTVTDANGCTFVPPPVTINVTPAPDALIKALLMNQLGQIVGTAYPTLNVCSGEDVHLQVQGNGVYNYVWSGGNGFMNEVFFTEDRGNLLSVGMHSYTVTVTNPANGCTSITDPFVITVNPNPGGFSISSSGSCANASNILTYTGPQPANWQFVWSTGVTGTNLSTEDYGNFFIRVVNEFGCEAKSNVVNILPGPQVSAIPSGCHERCAPDTLCIPNLPNITSWQWYMNGNAIAGATTPGLVITESGSYYAVLSDGTGCTAQSGPLNIQLTEGTGNLTGKVWSDVNDNGSVTSNTDTTLTGITVMLLHNGIPLDTTVSDANGIFHFNNLPTGWYVVMLDSTTFQPGWHAVIGKDSAYINGCAEMGFDSLELLMRFDCVPIMTSEFLSACEGSFAIYQGVPVPAGISQVFQSTGANGCDVFVMVTVVPIPASSGNETLYACPGSTASYQGIDLSVGTTQPFTLVNALGCDSIVTVNVLPLPTATGALTLGACPGSTVSYGGVDLPAGAVQDFMLVSSLGCDSIVTVTVTALPTSSSMLEVYVCPGETYLYQGVAVAIGQPQDFIWPNQFGCDSTVTLTVKAFGTPMSSLQVSACPGTTFDYQGQQIAIGTTQMVHLNSINGCDSIVMVSVTAFPNASFALTTTESCPNQSSGSLEITGLSGGTAPFEFDLNNNGNWQDAMVFSDLNAGTYTVQVRDASDCVFEEATEVMELPEIAFAALNGIIPCDSTEITLAPELLSGNPNDLKFSWSTGETTRFIKVSEAGTYTFSAQLSSGLCAATDGAIEVEWAELGKNDALVYMPNVIKPEASDPENGAFRPRFAAGLNILRYDFMVFDRWGTEIFHSKNPSDSWMGTFKGSKIRPGVLVWRLEADISFCGKIIPVRKEGDVALIR